VGTHPATFAALPLVLLGVVLLVRAERFVARADYAAQELAVQEAARALRLLGPYSRFGFDHPGPMFFYAAVPWYEVLGTAGGLALVLTRLCVDAACAALLVVLVDRIGGRTAAWGATVGLLWFELRVGFEWFRDPWNPYAVVLPTALALVAGAALLDGPIGRRWRSLVLVVAGSFALQSHLGAAPLVAVAVALGITGFVRSARRPDAGRVAADAALAAGVGLACWALPLWQQLTTSPGNLRDIGAFLLRSGQSHPGLGTVVDPVVGAVTLPAGHFGERLGSEPLSALPHIGLFWWCVLVLLTAAALACSAWSWRAGRVGMAALAACVPVGIVTAFVAGRQIRGDVEPYLFAPALAVGVVAWVTFGASTAELVAAGARRHPAHRHPARLATVGVVVVLSVTAVWVGRRAFDPLRESYESAFAAQLDSGIRAVCRDGRTVHLWSRSATWYEQVEVGAALGECAPDVTFDAALRDVVGDRRVASRDPSPDTVDVRLEAPGVPLAPGWKRVAHSADATLDMRG
jgi:hypothetical protein